MAAKNWTYPLFPLLALASAPSLKARYNIAPGDAVGIVRITSGFDGPESKKDQPAAADGITPPLSYTLAAIRGTEGNQ